MVCESNSTLADMEGCTALVLEGIADRDDPPGAGVSRKRASSPDRCDMSAWAFRSRISGALVTLLRLLRPIRRGKADGGLDRMPDVRDPDLLLLTRV